MQIEIIKLACRDLDWNYATECIKALSGRADKQDTFSFLNPLHLSASTELLREQSAALQHLVSFVESLKKCDDLKAKIELQVESKSKVTSLFL